MLIDKLNKTYYTINIGDSRVYRVSQIQSKDGPVSEKSKENKIIKDQNPTGFFSWFQKKSTQKVEPKLNIEKLTVDHNLKNMFEKERIVKNNGLLRNRVGGQLILTRAIGDTGFYSSGLTSEPDITRRQFTNEKLLILGSDGVWDFIGEDELIDCIGQHSETDVEKIAKQIVDICLEDSKDNISLIVVRVNQ